MLQAVSPKQLDFLRGSNRKVNILEGSIRSGKTIIALVRWMMFIATAPQTGALVMVGRTRDSVWRNMIGPLQDPTLFGALTDDVVGNYGAPTVRIFGRLVHVLGASDAKSEKVLRGLTVAGAMVDEITTIPEEFFTQLLGRMSVNGAQLFGTTNPDGPAHWFKKKFLDRIGSGKGRLPHWTRWRFTMDDNPSLSPEYIAEKKLEFTGLFYKRFIEGLWVAAEGAVFDFWDESEHVVAWDKLPPMQRYFGCGIDYGTTHATSAIILGLGVDGVLYFVDEWRYEAADRTMRLNDATITTAIKEWLPVPHIPHPSTLQPEWVIIDPAAASLHVEFGTQGVRNVIPANNEVLYGIRTMSSLMANGKLKVSDRCQGLISEMPGYSWDPTASLRGEDKPIKTADDSIDPARYVVATTETNWRALVDLAA